MINLHDDILTLLDANELYLICHIAKRMSRDNIAFPSNETLLKDTGWKDKRTLNKIKKSLVSKGVLEISERYKGEKQTSNNYKITTNLVGFFIGLGNSQERTLGGAKNAPHSIECNLGGAKNAPGGGTKNAPLSINPIYKGINSENVDDLDFSIRKEKELFEYFDKNPAQVEAIKDHCRWAFTDEQFQDTIKEYVLNPGNVAQLHKDPQRQMKAIYRWFQRQKRFSKPLPSKAKKTSGNTSGALLDKTLTGLMKEGYEKYLRQVKEKYPALYASNCKVLTASEFEDIFSMKKFPQYRIKGKLTLKEKLWDIHELFNDKSYHRNTKDSITPMLEDYLTDKIKINGDLQRRSA